MFNPACFVRAEKRKYRKKGEYHRRFGHNHYGITATVFMQHGKRGKNGIFSLT
jgi:hypothetical protein